MNAPERLEVERSNACGRFRIAEEVRRKADRLEVGDGNCVEVMGEEHRSR